MGDPATVTTPMRAATPAELAVAHNTTVDSVVEKLRCVEHDEGLCCVLINREHAEFLLELLTSPRTPTGESLR